MKVLFVNNSFVGLVNFRVDVMMHLQELGHEVVGVVPSSERNMLEEKRVKIKYVPLHRTSTNPFYDILFFFSIVKVFLREKPDYVFFYTIKPNIYGTLAARLCGVSSSMMMAGLGYSFFYNSLSCRIARGLYRFALKFSDYLFVLNEHILDTVIKMRMCDPKKIIHLEGGEGVNLQRYQFHDNKSDKVCFLFVGRLLKEKGVFEFVEAASVVKSQYPEVMFQIAGVVESHSLGSLETKEVNAVMNSGIVEFIGFIDMVKKLEEPGIVIVLPSYTEGMNHSLMEGCATGKPIITTDQPGCREMVIEGKNGFIVPVRQSKPLAEAMLRYIALPDEKKLSMSLESRRLAESRFDVQRVYGIYEKILKR